MNNPKSNGPEIKILVVDKDQTTLTNLQDCLGSFGQVDSATSFSEAVTLVKECHYELVFADFQMEYGNGLDLAKFINGSGTGTLMIFFSNFSTVEELTQLFNYQVYSVISKPFTYEKIKTLGKQAVEQIQWQRTNERLARVGLMAAEMIHEINNPLALVDLGLENLEKKYTQEKIIQTMKKGILRVNSIITRTKNKVRGDDSRDYGIFVVRDAIREAEEEFSRKASQAGVIVEVLGDQNDTLFGDKDDIKRVIVNLVNNSIDAISNLSEKWIKISIKSGPLGVSLNVTDSGNGIPEELRRKIFTTMFTTKGKFGTGLGLGLCRRIANEHGGNLYLVADAKNTTFALLLPKKTLSGITKLNSEQSG